MTRKIIQIVVTKFDILGFMVSYRQHALCDDGTLWYRDALNKKDCIWYQVDEFVPGTK